jgi:hypothetical protein
MLVTVSRAGHDHHLLFDAGMTPNGLSDNMRRMGLSPFDIELVVLSALAAVRRLGAHYRRGRPNQWL